jgi:hypothetical protein
MATGIFTGRDGDVAIGTVATDGTGQFLCRITTLRGICRRDVVVEKIFQNPDDATKEFKKFAATAPQLLKIIISAKIYEDLSPKESGWEYLSFSIKDE